MISLVSIYIGSLTVLTIYHVFVFIGRRKDYINLVYAFYCLSLANLLFARMLDVKYNNIFFEFYYIFSVHLLVGLLTLFAYFIFRYKNDKYLKNILFVYLGVSLILIILICSFFILKNKIVLKIYFPVLSAYGIFFIFFIVFIYFIKGVYKKKKITLLAIGFFSLILFLLTFSFLLFFNIRIQIHLLYLIYYINALFFAYALTAGFNKEHRDLIDLKNTLEKKVHERTGELKVSHDQKINFFINLVHETKTPLTLLLNYLNNDIKKRGLSEDIKIAKQNADKLKNDMINFLDMEKLNRGQVFYNHEQTIDFSKVLKIKVIQFKDFAYKKNIGLEWEINDDIFIDMDPIALDRIINNLLENAVKYTDEFGEIIVHLRLLKNKIILEICDTGIGISDAQIKNIFKPYHQISHKKRNIQGIGMGLNIIKKIMNEINGDIEVKSELGKGSKFILRFMPSKLKKHSKPIIKFNKNKFEKMENINDIGVNNKKSILIIEDNMDMLKYLYDTLSIDYNIYTAKNGFEGLEELSKIPKTNLIISDIMMDIMDGYEFYEKMQENVKYQAIPLIFLTAKTSFDEKLNGLKKGAIDFIYKPFSIDELQNKIASILKLQERQKKDNIQEFGIKFSQMLYSDSDKDNILSFNIICSNYKINLKDKEIIRLVLDGMEYKDISTKLAVSVNVVRNRLHQIYKKFNVKNKFELVNLFKNR